MSIVPLPILHETGIFKLIKKKIPPQKKIKQKISIFPIVQCIEICHLENSAAAHEA